MRDNEFEWDDTKAASNEGKHDVSFVDAAFVFADEWMVSDDDLSSSLDEDRFLATGMVDLRMLTVSYTYRGPRIRIISARPATEREQNDYYRNKASA
jgi:uncharacterized protein